LSEIQAAQFPVRPPGRSIFGPIAASDGFLNLSIASERTFRALAAACERPDWISDPRFAQYQDRRDNWGALIDEVEDWSRQRTMAEVQAIFDRRGVPASPYRTVREALADPQLAHREALTEVRDRGGSFKVLNPPFRMSGAEARVREFAAALGEHTAAILTELGCTPGELARLTASASRA
jgi:crotonobetainyl-CoA:carnitine CoA-transferase CaiB-like acyl-CoA transferase